MKRSARALYRKVGRYAGYLVILTFCIFSYASFFSHPGPYNPFNNNLSQLGNYYLNPNGAVFFNTGMVLSGILILPFYHQLSKKQPKYVRQIVSIGAFNSLSVVMAGIFSESVNFTLHTLWSLLIFITFLPILYFVNKSPETSTGITRLIRLYGWTVVSIDGIFLILQIFLGVGTSPIFEWLSVFTYLGWIGLISRYYS